MKIWLYGTIPASILISLLLEGKSNSHKKKSEDATERWVKEHFDSRRINVERAQAGANAIGIYAFFSLFFL
jgi:hypothetical protein